MVTFGCALVEVVHPSFSHSDSTVAAWLPADVKATTPKE